MNRLPHKSSPTELLLELVNVAAAARAHEIVGALERHGYTWRPLGGKEGNFGLVNIGSDPALALVERFTNAIDAVIERAARDAPPALVAKLDTPREAVAELFAVPEGQVSTLGAESLERLAHGVTIALVDGTNRERPTIEIRDRGCGLSGVGMTTSILDLAGSNKLDKPYLAGAYGQGGSTTFAFTGGGSTIVSSPDDRTGSITFVRYRALDPRKNKNGRYEYLVDAHGAVPAFDAVAAQFERGTLVRHFDYELPRYNGSIDAADGLLGLASAALFDPVLPVRFVDSRSYRRGAREQVFAGTVALLAALAAVEVEQSLGIPLGRRGTHGLVAIRYWLLATGDAAVAFRSDDRNAVFVSNFGQTHDAWGRAFVVDELRFPFLKASLIIQVELDGLTAAAKRQLLSSTRDRLKHGTLFNVLQTAVRDALADEPALQDANAERRRLLLAKQRAGDHDRLQRRFAELMEAFRPGTIPAASVNGKHGEVTSSNPSGGASGPGEQLPTLEQPTFLRFGLSDHQIQLPHGRAVRVVVESDAPDGYVAKFPAVRLVIAPDPPDAVVFIRATDFRGGRARVVLRADAAIGATGVVAARLTDAAGTVLAATASFLVIAPPPPQPADAEGNKRVSVPNVFEITRDRWHEHGFDERSVAILNESRDDISIFINVDNIHLVRLIDAVQYQQTGLTRMRSAFVVQTAFYAFLQHRARAILSHVVAAAEFDSYERQEFDRLAQTIVSSIAAIDKIDSASLTD